MDGVPGRPHARGTEEGWSLMIFCARAAGGLRRMREEWPGALLARGTRTMKQCSSDRAVNGSLATPLR
jgi:hypothetical protein